MKVQVEILMNLVNSQNEKSRRRVILTLTHSTAGLPRFEA
jgi:hypothetical protein